MIASEKMYDKIYKVLLVLLSLFNCHVSLSHISEEGKNLLEYDSREKSLKCHFFYVFSDYAMFLFRNKRCCLSNFQLIWSCYSYIF